MSKYKETMKDIFDNVYTEYKEYKTFYEGTLEEVKQKRESFEKYVLENSEDNQKILDELFSLNEAPIQQQNDINRLQMKLYFTYENYKPFIDIPKEVAQEISKMKVINTYLVKDGEAHEIDKEHNDKVREMARGNYQKAIDDFLGEEGKDE